MNEKDLVGLRCLLETMARLRDPVTGCPWDLAQTPQSIAPWTIEEACEVADAAEEGDVEHWREELGDLLFHVVFHARLAEEAGRFGFDNVAAGVAAKLERRHPHVFADAQAPAAGDFNREWERDKSTGREHIGETLPKQLPALMMACKLQKRAAAVGFDWPDVNGPREKITEELNEIEQALAGETPSAGEAASTKVLEEFGDLLFAVVNYARHLGVEPEQALRAANRKFIRRFRHIESRLSEQGLQFNAVELKHLDSLWDEAKVLENETRSLRQDSPEEN